MSKAEGDPRFRRDVPQGAAGTGASSEEDAKMKGASAAATNPDEIPPTHVLVAAHDQDRKETEELLAGFDRPGRGPKKPPRERDFVDYYAKKKDEGGARGERRPSSSSPAPPVVAGPKVKQADVATVVKPRKKDAPPLAVWLSAGAAMLLVGGAVAFVATQGEPKRPVTVSTAPGPATTISSASPGRGGDDIPPPPPAEEGTAMATSNVVVTAAPPVAPSAPSTASAAAPRASGKREPRGQAGAGAASASAGGGAGVTPAGTANGASGANGGNGANAKPHDDSFIREMK